MKANAPKKIFLYPYSTDGIYEVETKPLEGTVEYTRTDAFIEKAISWLKESVTNNPECNRIISKKGVITIGEIVKDFRKYIEGE